MEHAGETFETLKFEDKVFERIKAVDQRLINDREKDNNNTHTKKKEYKEKQNNMQSGHVNRTEQPVHNIVGVQNCLKLGFRDCC